ncbi:MAG: hypothetical protein GY854_35105 [Deltaproteobacteria bacterium]|nr:hypothetical protein [Deltaproteobacteria bacterium]
MRLFFNWIVLGLLVIPFAIGNVSCSDDDGGDGAAGDSGTNADTDWFNGVIAGGTTSHVAP